MQATHVAMRPKGTNYSGRAVSASAPGHPREVRLATIALVSGTLVWGTIWFPYRALSEAGYGALSASLLTYLVAFLLSIALFRGEGLVRPDLELLVLAVAAGFTNVGYIWATNHGVILRVLLLFYLMPVWTTLFAWALVGTAPTWRSLGLLLLALSGAALMLYRPGAWPLPASAAEWAALAAGMCFALSNVLVHKAEQHSARCKSIWVLGGCVVTGAVGLYAFEPLGSTASGFFAPVLILVLGLVLFCVNVSVQYGLERLPPTRVPLIYLFELVVAALSSWLLAKETIQLQEMLGGALILGACLMPHEAAPPQAVERAPATAP
jgi:drug/metabolite transporter (DMT)-like permease